MKILFFIGTLTEGGAERVVSTLANKLVGRNFDVEILKYYKSENFYKLNDKVITNSIEEKTNTINKISNIKYLRKYIKDNADIVISFLAPFNIYSLISNIGNNVPIIVADRNDPRRIPSNFLMRKLRDILYRNADGVVLQTKNNLSYFSEAVQKKSTIIYNPFDLKESKGIALETKKDNIIVNVARLEKQKNHILLINAFNEIKDEFDDYKLVIYGEGNYKNELIHHINELKLSDRVILAGEHNDIINKIKSSKLFVLSSDYEGMPNSLIEAMCIGLPVISTKVSGSNELIEDGNNGLLVDINNKEELVKAMKKMLKDNDYSNSLANNATRICEIVDSNIVVDKWIDFINKVKK